MELIKGFSIWLEGRREGDKAESFFRYEEPLDWSRTLEPEGLELDHQLFSIWLKGVRRPCGLREALEFKIDFVPRVSFESRRIALVLHPTQRCPLVFDRHGEIRDPVQPWYWLGPAGLVELGDDRQKGVLAPRSGFSSVEFNSLTSQIWLNLDLVTDHLHVKDDPERVFQNLSYERMSAGRRLCGRFRFLCGVGLENLLLPVVHRGRAWGTLVWTEHACVSSLGAQRAVFFGSSEVERIEDAWGGFAKHGVPVTKSVFFSNPNRTLVDSQSAVFQGETATLQGSSSFRELVTSLYGAGLVEVGLHCVAPESTPMTTVAEAMRHLAENYRSRFWIDHVWFKKGAATSGSKEAFTLDGGGVAGRRTEMDELWERHGVRYFWNPATDYCPEYLSESRPISRCFGARGAGDLESLRHPFPQRLDILDPETPGLSRPLAWVTPNSTVPHISWVARFFNDCRAAFEPVRVEDLMMSGGVSINHTYPAYAGATTTWVAKHFGVEIDPVFDANLRFIGGRIREGRLWVPFLSDLLDRYLGILGLCHDLDEEGRPCVVNESGYHIEEVALNAAFPKACIQGRVLSGAQIGSGMYRFVYPEMRPGETVRMESRYA